MNKLDALVSLEGSCVFGLEYRHKFDHWPVCPNYLWIRYCLCFLGPALSGPRQSRTHAEPVGPCDRAYRYRCKPSVHTSKSDRNHTKFLVVKLLQDISWRMAAGSRKQTLEKAWSSWTRLPHKLARDRHTCCRVGLQLEQDQIRITTLPLESSSPWLNLSASCIQGLKSLKLKGTNSANATIIVKKLIAKSPLSPLESQQSPANKFRTGTFLVITHNW